jgi:PAS domain S-box-containing protein
MKNSKSYKNRRSATYAALFVALFLGFILLRNSTWMGSTQLHTIMELIATTLALFVGAVALVRYYTRKNSTYLFIGVGFLGTAMLDGYHTVVTSTFFDQVWLSPPPNLIPWSWNASRFFLSILMVLSWWVWKREEKLGKVGRVREKSVFFLVGCLTVASFFFFAFFPLPRAYYPELFFGRPEEFVSAFFFLLALYGYLTKGWWKRNRFEHWVVLSLIVGFMGQAMFMSFSFQLFDPMFDIAHLLKKVSYICVLTGLLVSMFHLFRCAEEGERKLNNILDSSPDSIIMTDLKGDIKQCNKAGLEMHGFSKQKEMTGMNILDLVTPEDRGPMENWKLLPEIGSVMDIETVLLRKDGSKFSALVSAKVIADNDGKPRFVVATGKDITEQKAAEQSLKESERKFRLLFESVPTGIGLADMDGNTIDCNRHMEKLLGYTLEEFKSFNIADLWVDADQRKTLFDELKKNGNLRDQELELKRKDGKVIYALTNIDVIERDEKLALLITCRDITSIKMAGKRMERLSHLKEQMLIPASLEEKLWLATEGIVEIFDADFARIWLTRQGDRCDTGCIHAAVKEGLHVCRNKDKCLHLMVSSGRYTHIDGEVHRRVPFGCYKIGNIAAGEGTKFLTNYVTSDPRVHDREWAKKLGLTSFAGYRLMSPTEGPIGVLALFSKHVISEGEDLLLENIAGTLSQVILTSSTEEALRDSDKRFRKFMEGVTDVIYRYDPQGRSYDFLSPSFAMQTGYTMEELMSDPAEVFRRLTHPEDIDHVVKTTNDHIKKGPDAGPLVIEYRGLRKDGEAYWVSERRDFEFTPDGKVFRINGVVRDISEQKNAECMKDEFVSVVSHEIRTPLTSIHGSLSLIAGGKAGEFPEKAKSLIEIAARNSKRLRTLIDDILDLQKIESGRVELNLEPLELKPFVEQAIEANKIYADQYDSEYVLELDLPDVKVKADSNCLMQVMNNLLSNAAKYSPEETPVEISLSRHDGSVRVSVKDHGAGIPKNFQGCIFQKFQRADSAATREKGGTGLGLSIAKSIIELHGGKIDFETGLGEGTTFYFDLPEWRDKDEEEEA